MLFHLRELENSCRISFISRLLAVSSIQELMWAIKYLLICCSKVQSADILGNCWTFLGNHSNQRLQQSRYCREPIAFNPYFTQHHQKVKPFIPVRYLWVLWCQTNSTEGNDTVYMLCTYTVLLTFLTWTPIPSFNIIFSTKYLSF